MSPSKASDAYAQWIETLIAHGFQPWFATFMFRQLPGSAAARQHQMLKAVGQIYGLRITRVIKHPRAARNRDRRPIWLAAPDLPIFKHLKQTLQVILVNDGLHVHAIILEPIDRRFPECFAEFAWAEQRLWRPRCPELDRLDVRAITHDAPRVTSYLTKHIGRLISDDGVLVLPETNDELRKGSGRVGRRSSIFAAIPKCLVPGSRDAKLSREAEEALWQSFFMAAPPLASPSSCA